MPGEVRNPPEQNVPWRRPEARRSVDRTLANLTAIGPLRAKEISDRSNDREFLRLFAARLRDEVEGSD